MHLNKKPINNKQNNLLDCSVADPDPFLFGQPNPGSQKSAKIMENLKKKSTKIIKISYIFSKILNLCSTDINIYPINNKKDNFLENFIFNIYIYIYIFKLVFFPDPL